MAYDHSRIEKKWQKFWADNKIFKAKIDKNKKKYYILDMFPYPSGAGLHVGHVTGYTGTDIIARFKRQQGYNVLHPMGWDSFGLPAEQYAIRTGTHPAVTTEKNINTYRSQLKNLGFSYDWDREIATSDPSYYKWTQWIFTKLYEKGLAYEAEINVNYCPALGTVLANEEVENGFSKEGRYPVEKRPLRQWILKITAYAERLLDDLKDIDWPENLKKLQMNWIGKSEGATISFEEKKTKEKIFVFTTRSDTIFGVTYIVLSPEHPLVKKITTREQKKEVEDYQNKAINKSDIERMDTTKDKTGAFTGAHAIHPITKEEIPIWIADYVLLGYGTGAVMAVPAHDERDYEFAKRYNLSIKSVYHPDESLITEEDLKETTKEQFIEDVVQGNVCWTKDGEIINSSSDSFSINGLNLSEGCKKAISYFEKNNIGEKTISYKLRDWLFSRQRYWGEPIPVLHFEDGTERVLGLDELPLIPPPMKDFKPAGGGKSPLTKVKEWTDIIDPKTNKKAKRETNTMPQWAGSCWYYLRFCDPNNAEEAWSEESENYWMPVDMYVGGAEHAVLHLLYARFWHKVLYDCNLVSTKEPFQSYRYQGVVTAPSYRLPKGGYVSPEDVVNKNERYFHATTNEELIHQVEKMSKSKLNGVTPDEMIEEFGADALRLYEMFLGPFDREKIWNTDAITGCKRFLTRFYDIATSEKVIDELDEESLKLAHRLLYTVSNEIENMQFNTSIAHLMEFLNSLSKLNKISKESIRIATQALYPFAPHLSEEIWEILGQKTYLSYEPLPKINDKYLQNDKVTYVIQINGKLRGRFEMDKDLSKEDVLKIAKEDENIKKHLSEDILKIIFVPNKLLNIVVKK